MTNQPFTWKTLLDDLLKDTQPQVHNEQDDGITETYMRTVMQNHIDMINKETAVSTSLYYADDIVVEDPYGATRFKGKEGQRQGFRQMADVSFIPQKAELVAPISTSYGNKAAMAFKLYAQIDGHDVTIDIIETMTFNDAGDITERIAYWGKENVTLLD